MNKTITIDPATDNLANLDIYNGQPTEEGCIDDDDTDTEYQLFKEYLGRQQEFVKAIQMRLKDKVNQNKNSTNHKPVGVGTFENQSLVDTKRICTPSCRVAWFDKIV